MYLPILILLFSTCTNSREVKTITIPNQGAIIGTEISMLRVHKIIGYFGIPYAQAPLKTLRFSDPVTDPLPSWDGVRNGSQFGKACLQTKRNFAEADALFYNLIAGPNHTLEADEDCLFLNVFLPAINPPEDGFTTILWFHPGKFTTGAPHFWNPHPLVYKHRVIIVTFSFRLNIMGFFTTLDGEAAGNYGLRDQQAAMMWVKKNIQLFGGNPDNICLMGYGSGGESIGLHMVNKQSRNYFHKAIIMSGNFLTRTFRYNTQDNKHILDVLADSFGCNRNPTPQLLACLRNAEPDQLIERTSDIEWGPIIDTGLSNMSQPFLEELPKTFYEREDFYQIPLLTGYTNMEDVLYIKGIDPENGTSEYFYDLFVQNIFAEDQVRNSSEGGCVSNDQYGNAAVEFFYGPTNVLTGEQMRQVIAESTTDRRYAAPTYFHASYVSKKQNTYLYRFDRKPVTSWLSEHLPEWVGLPHLFDLIYLWGIPYWNDASIWHFRDKRHADMIMSLWTNFAKVGNPTNNAEIIIPIKWDQFSEKEPRILIIDDFFTASNRTNINYKAFEFWNRYYPKVVEISSKCCDSLNGCATVKSCFSIVLFWTFVLAAVYG